MAPVVEMLNITKRFPGVLANDQVTITVDQGQILGLIGENGAGKSTMMNMLYGLFQPDEGTIRLFGKEVRIQSPNQAISMGIGMVHQHFMLMPNLTVLQNIILGKEPEKHGFIDTAAARERILEIMNTYDLQVDLDERIYQLSVGQKQRVEIVKALYREAKILIMDEPTAVLTPQETDKLILVLQKLRDEGTAIIFITHKLREVMALTDKVIVMRKGVVTGTLATKDADMDLLSNLMVGREVDLDIPRADIKPGEEVLSVKDLKVRNKKGLYALRGVSFQVRKGEIVGIAGVEGNGQTELIECVAGMLRPEEGQVFLDGQDVTRMAIRKRREAGLSHIPEDRLKVGTAKTCTIRDNLIMNRYYRKPYARQGVMDNRKLLELSEKLCEDFQIKTPDSTYLLSTLSGGNMQKVVFAREMEVDPELLVAAQPTRGVDIGAIEYIHGELVKMRDAGKAVLLISADLDELMRLSDKIAVLYDGRIVDRRDASEYDERTLGALMTGHAPDSVEKEVKQA